MTSAEVVADGLRGAGVARAFAAEGADPALIGALRATGLPIVAVRHAASAITMASVTGQLGNAPGVAVVGDTGDVSVALAASMRAHAPVIVLASAVLPESATALVKTTVVAGAESASHWAAHAAQAAMGEPPGPVWLVVAPDVAARAALPVATAARPAAIPFDAHALDAVARHLAAATRPLIVAGRECRAGATAGWLRALSESLPAPVLVTPAARGALPDPHPLCFGPLARDAPILDRADLVVALGVGADELADAGVTLATPLVRLGRASWDTPELAAAQGDVATLLEELAPRLRDRVRADWDVAEVDRLRRARPVPAVDAPLRALVTELREATPAGTIAVFARALAPASAFWLAVNPGELLVEDAVVPAAIGAALERPDVGVLALVDGVSETPLAELPVAVEARARVIVVDAFAPWRAQDAHALGAALDAAGPTVLGSTRRV